MTNRNRDELDREERERMQRNRYSTSGYGSSGYEGDESEQGRSQYGLPGGRREYAGREQAGRDRDIQGDYSWRERGGFSESGHGREGSYPQSRAMSSDDFSQQRVQGRYAQSGRASRADESRNYGRDYSAQEYGSDYREGSRDYEPQGFSSRGTGSMGSGSTGYGLQGGRSQGEYGYGADYGERDFNAYRNFGAQGSSAQTHWQGSQPQAGGRYGSMGYRGIGPKNYVRSDERIREDLNERLTDADDIDASGVTVEVSNGVATLSGTVDQRWMKHRAEDIAESCSGVRDVNNQIRVASASSGASSGAYRPTASTTGTGTTLGSATAASSGTTSGTGPTTR